MLKINKIKIKLLRRRSGCDRVYFRKHHFKSHLRGSCCFFIIAFIPPDLLSLGLWRARFCLFNKRNMRVNVGHLVDDNGAKK